MKSNEQCLSLGIWKSQQIFVQVGTQLTTVFLLNLFGLSFRQETICWRDNFAMYMKNPP